MLEEKLKVSEEKQRAAEERVKATEEQLKAITEKLKGSEGQLSTLTEKLGSTELLKNQAEKAKKECEQRIQTLESDVTKSKEVSLN